MVQTKSGEQNKNTNFITSEKFLATKAATKPIVSSNMARSVSGYRRGVLEEEILRGNFQDANNPIPKEILSSPAGYIVSSSKKISKTASAGDASGSGQVGGGYRGGGGTLRQSPNIYSPLWLNSNLNLPRDRATVNAWSRAFFALNGYVHNAIDLHSTYPISKLNIKCKSPAVEKFFQEMIEELNLIQICSQIAQEYWIIGEAFIYAELDEAARKWNRLIIQNPDYMVVQRSVVDDEPIISIRPDDNLKRICTSQKASDQIQRQKLDKSIIEHVRRGENIPLNNFYVHHIARKINPYDVRGTGLIVNSFKPLMLFDKLIEAKYAQADDMVNPITLVKIGGDDYKATPADLTSWRDTFEEASNDLNFKIFTHDKVTVERVGANSAILDINPDLERIVKQVLTGLMVPSVLMDGGADTTYANGSVALDVLKSRYMAFRNKLTLWLRKKIFAPIAKMNDFYEKVDGKNVLIIPDIEWNHMSLFDMGDYTQILKELSSGETKIASKQTLFRSMGLAYEDENQKIRQESIDETIREKEKEALSQMSLSELRALGPNDQIKEVIQSPLPGEERSLPGQQDDGSSGGGLPGMEDLGGGMGSSSPPPPPAPEPSSQGPSK